MSEISNKQGRVKTCPNCGANVSSFRGNCPECGHEFRDSGDVKSMSSLFEKIDIIENSNKKNEAKIDAKCELIRSFPIPNDKEDLLEFISVSEANASPAHGMFATKMSGIINSTLICLVLISLIYLIYKLSGISSDGLLDIIIFIIIGVAFAIVYYAAREKNEIDVAAAWDVKFKAARNKVKILAIKDPALTKQMNIVLSEYNKKIRLSKIFRIILIFLLIVCAVLAISIPKEPSRKAIKNGTQEEIIELIDKQEYNKAERKFETYQEEYSYSSDYYKNYFDFLQKVITSMCENGEFDEARRYIKIKSKKFPEEGAYNCEPREEIEELLQDIVSIYDSTSNSWSNSSYLDEDDF